MSIRHRNTPSKMTVRPPPPGRFAPMRFWPFAACAACGAGKLWCRCEAMESKIMTGSTAPIEWPDPTPQMMNDPRFEAVWQCIKTWDINVPGAYAGYMGATGNHVRAILDALEGVGK
jgi:hypothetical protein